jgi:hypothetical protein
LDGTQATNCSQPALQNYIYNARDPIVELLNTGYFFPNFPVTSKVTDVFVTRRSEDDSCTKDYKKSGKLGAGVVLYWCIKHRECIGFNILESAESCQSIYDVLSSRATIVPKIMIYDNACNLFEVQIS